MAEKKVSYEDLVKKRDEAAEKLKALDEKIAKEKKPYDPEKDIDALPQAKWIDDLKKVEWIKRVREIDPGREEWHVRRLKGFGGSEIGALMMARKGEYHPFTSAADIVRGKLLESTPEESKGNLARGSIMEPLARDEYRKMLINRYGADRVKFREDLFEVAMNYKDPDPNMQWLIGTPDDIVEVDGVLQVIDYKVPKPQNLLDYDINGVPFYYAAQLHHYRLILEKSGYQVGKLTLASLNTDTWTIDERDVAISDEMEQDLIETGTMYWNDYVALGEIPPANLEKRATDKIDLPEDIRNMIKNYTVWATLMNRAKDNTEAAKKLLAERRSCIDTGIDVINYGMTNVKVERVYDEEGLRRRAAEEGIPVGDYKKKGSIDKDKVLLKLQELLGCSDMDSEVFDCIRTDETLDIPALVNALRDSHINTAEFIVSEKLGFAIGSGKKRDIVEMKEGMDDAARGQLGHIAGEIGHTYDSIMESILLAEQERRAPQKVKPK